MDEIISIWKSLKITHSTMEFSCGGDSMNDYHFKFFTENDVEVKSDELEGYFDNKIFDNVEFYVNSDGHYLGESGNVTITLIEEEGEETFFQYDKDSMSDWSENFSEVGKIILTESEKIFIIEKVESIVGSSDNNTSINYKDDFILTDDEEQMINDLSDKIYQFCEDFEFQNEIDNAEPEPFFVYTTNIDDVNELNIIDNKMAIQIERSFTYQTEE
jgi:hypothetical protein